MANRHKISKTKNKNRILPTNDYLFKRIFSYPKSEEITKDFLSCILSKKINNIELDTNLILEKNLCNDKFGILDLKAKIDGEICNVEMQITNKHNLEKRILYYWSKMYSSEIKEGEDYINLKKVKAILIVDFDIEQFKNVLKYKTDWKIREKDNHNMILTDD